jgi:predicted Rossmann fold flavoprotein
MQMMTRHHLTWNEKTLGQLFCDQRAEAVLKMLQRECRDHKVDIRTGVRVEGVSASPDGGFDVSLGKKSMHADAVVIACGGLSLPKIGATSLGFKVADSFGLTVVPPRAGLVPFVFTEACRALWSPLAGLSTPATVSCGGVSFSEAVLFTHKGLSGPAILQASSYWQNGEPVVIDLLPGIDAGEMLINAKLKTPKLAVKSVLAKHFPKRLAERLCQVLKAEGTLITLSDKALKQVGEGINRWTIVPQSTEGYRTAEVTVGGVDTAELSSKTMETKRVPGLYFIGEVVDVTGWLGGYNFQWSWASGSAAGEAV